MKDDYVNYPANDGDIDGIYRYLGWHMNKAGLSSTCFHYLEVLKKMAEARRERVEDRSRDTW